MKKRPKNTISNYNDLLTIKGELRSRIEDHEESFKEDIAYTGNVIKVLKISLSKKKSKKDSKFVKQSFRLLIDDLFVRFIHPYAKNEKQRQVYIPLVSTVLSFFIVDRISAKFKSQ